MNKKKLREELESRELALTMKEETKERGSTVSDDMEVSESLMWANWIMSITDFVSCLSNQSFQQSENRILAQKRLTECRTLLKLINSHLRHIHGSGLDIN